MILHSWKCSQCGDIFEEYTTVNLETDRLNPVPCKCGGTTQIHWVKSGSVAINTIHPKDRTVVFRNPQTGNWTAPDRNDRPMPDRLRQRGYERVELTSLREVEKFEAQTKFRCEKAHYDDGSGSTRDDGTRGA